MTVLMGDCKWLRGAYRMSRILLTAPERSGPALEKKLIVKRMKKAFYFIYNSKIPGVQNKIELRSLLGLVLVRDFTDCKNLYLYL